MTEGTPNPLWSGITLDQVTESFLHLGTSYGHGLMVQRALSLSGPFIYMNQHFCDEVGRLLLKA